MNSRLIGLLGLIATIVGGAANIVGGYIDKKQTEALIDERVSKALADRKEENNEEEEETEE